MYKYHNKTYVEPTDVGFKAIGFDTLVKEEPTEISFLDTLQQVKALNKKHFETALIRCHM